MATQLNIKDPHVVGLAEKLARQSGRSMTATIRDALEREDRDREALIEERIRAVNEIIDEVRRTMPPETRAMTSWQIMESIYDDDEPDGFAP